MASQRRLCLGVLRKIETIEPLEKWTGTVILVLGPLLGSISLWTSMAKKISFFFFVIIC